MSSSPSISLPQIPKDLDPALRDYLTALTKVITSKQIDDYTKRESDKSDLTQAHQTLTSDISDINSSLQHMQLYSNVLGADVAMASANAWYTGCTLTLPAGEYLVFGQLTVLKTTATAATYSGKITDGTNNYSSAGDYKAAVANNIITLPMFAKIVLTTDTTITMQATANVVTTVIKAALVTNASGNTATQLIAIRIR